MFKWIAAYDSFLLLKTYDFIFWLQEWASISQRRVEIFLTIVYAIGSIFSDIPFSEHLFDLVCIALVVFIFTLSALTDTASGRMNRLASGNSVFLRWLVSLIFIILFPVHLWIAYRVPSEWAWIVRNLSVTLLIYVQAISVDGEPGKRRKMDLSKLKELFGAKWMVDPLPAPH